jgi:hypothetical protein
MSISPQEKNKKKKTLFLHRLCLYATKDAHIARQLSVKFSSMNSNTSGSIYFIGSPPFLFVS